MDPNEREAWNLLFDEAKALVAAYDFGAPLNSLVQKIENLRDAVHSVGPLELPAADPVAEPVAK
jgi:hypothetical protein